MLTIGLDNFIFGPSLFDLYPTDYTAKGTPCLIRVGPRRFLERELAPETCRMLIKQTDENGQNILTDLPAKFTTKNGKPFFDAPTVLDQLGIKYGFCDSQSYKWYKTRPYSDTLERGPLGVCACRYCWLDISVYTSSLHFVPGALTLCGKQVDQISWESFDECSSTLDDQLRAICKKAVSSPHTLDAEQFLKLAGTCKELSFNHLGFRTQQGSFGLSRCMIHELSVALDGQSMNFEIDHTSPEQALSLLLDLLQAQYPQGILNRMVAQGTLRLK